MAKGRKIQCEVYGNCPAFHFDPHDFIDVEDIIEFEDDLNMMLEDDVTYGVKLVGESIESLWEEVQKVKGNG